LAQPKKLHRRFLLSTIVDSFEPIIIPAKFHGVRIHHRLLAEIDIAVFTRGPMSPRANNHLALLACDRRLALLANSHVAVERPLRQDVVPPTKRVYRNPDRLEALFDAQGSPVVVVGRMLKPIQIKKRMATAQGLHIVQEQMPENPPES